MPHEIPEYMSADYVKDKTSVDILWSQLRTLQDIAQEFGIDNIFQDNGAEILQQLIYLNMKAVPGREGNDGVDEKGCEWEMKSLDISKGNQGITTNHHLNASIIEKYRTVPWSISIYDGIHLKKIYVVGNEQLQSLFAKWEEQLQTVESINNPKIPLSYIEENGVLIYQEGDEYPTNPMTVINTTPYIPVQRAYFRKIDCQNEVDKLEKELLVVNLKELHHEFFIAITNCNIGCFQHPNHFLLVVDSEALIGEIIFGCLTDCLVDVVSSLSLFHV